MNLVTCFFGAMLLSLVAAHPSSAAESAHSAAPVPAQCLKLVQEHVKRTRGWDAAAYVVDAESVDAPGHGFSVWLLSELSAVRPPGGGESFHVDTDQHCTRIVRELAYQ